MELGFHPKHETHIHPFVGWMAVLGVTLTAALPLTLFAREPDRPTGSEPNPIVHRLPAEPVAQAPSQISDGCGVLCEPQLFPGKTGAYHAPDKAPGA